MTQLRKTQWLPVLGLLLIAWQWCGCRSSQPVFSEVPGVAPAGVADSASDDRIQVGDLVMINFAQVGAPLPSHEERVKEDGTITLPLLGSVPAAGRTPSELWRDLRHRYRKVGRIIYTPHDHPPPFYVVGEVNQPGPRPYIGKTTVTKAIQAAGDFTDFANKKKVILRRADGRQETVNVLIAVSDPSHDPRVYPGDRIEVPRKWRFGY